MKASYEWKKISFRVPADDHINLHLTYLCALNLQFIAIAFDLISFNIIIARTLEFVYESLVL